MTAYETWVTETARALLADIKESSETEMECVAQERGHRDYLKAEFDAEWNDTEQKVAIGLTQARALECRQLAAELLKQGTAAALTFASALMDRSQKLEAIGMLFAQQWPPQDRPLIEVTK